MSTDPSDRDRLQRLFDGLGELATEDRGMADDILRDAGYERDELAAKGAELARRLYDKALSAPVAERRTGEAEPPSATVWSNGRSYDLAPTPSAPGRYDVVDLAPADLSNHIHRYPERAFRVRVSHRSFDGTLSDLIGEAVEESVAPTETLVAAGLGLVEKRDDWIVHVVAKLPAHPDGMFEVGVAVSQVGDAADAVFVRVLTHSLDRVAGR